MRVRRPGGGRRPLSQTDRDLIAALELLIDPATRGDPESPLRWTCKSTRRLADELTRQRHPVSAPTVATLLRQAGYSLQANSKTREGAGHPVRLRQRPAAPARPTYPHRFGLTNGGRQLQFMQASRDRRA